MSNEIQYQVDQLLLEQGEYLPLEFLLQQGRLSYADYEAWRNGEFAYLDEALFGDPDHIVQQLQQAAEYLLRLGWQAETTGYQSWYKNNPQQLRFSQNSTLDRSFHQRHRKPQDQPQMDLFTDAPATNLVNGITQALIDRNPVEARRQLERLYDTAPDHIRLGELEYLVEAAESLTTSVDDVAADMQILHETLIPMAESLMANDSRNLLIPLWRRLSKALQDQPYQASQADLHISYTASQAMDWDTALEAVEQVAHWRTDPVLLLRHALASDHLHRRAEMLQSWFLLCWQFPEQSNALENSRDYTLRRQWAAFLELDPELPAQSFPAWLLINEPGLIRIMPEPTALSDKDEISCPASYGTLYRLQHMRLHSQATPADDNNMALRARLKQQAPILFQYFLGNIDKPI